MTATAIHPFEGEFARSEKLDATVMVELVEGDTAWVSFPDGAEEEVPLSDLTILPNEPITR